MLDYELGQAVSLKAINLRFDNRAMWSLDYMINKYYHICSLLINLLITVAVKSYYVSKISEWVEDARNSLNV